MQMVSMFVLFAALASTAPIPADTEHFLFGAGVGTVAALALARFAPAATSRLVGITAARQSAAAAGKGGLPVVETFAGNGGLPVAKALKTDYSGTTFAMIDHSEFSAATMAEATILRPAPVANAHVFIEAQPVPATFARPPVLVAKV
jgi:hypothetical protein